MFWDIMILFLGIISGIYAFPYGRWEYLNNNKNGGITVYIISAIGILLAIAQAII